MKDWRREEIVVSDELTGLSLVRDERDPPRFYLRLGKRSDIVSIGDVSDALTTYSVQVERFQALRLRAQQGLTTEKVAEATGLIQQSPSATADTPAQVH